MAEIYDVLNKGLYKIKPIKDNVFEINPEQLGPGSILSTLIQNIGEIKNGKIKFNNVDAGYILGVDGGVAKFYIGDNANYFNWDGTTLTISGTLSAGAIDIGGSDATSFHVDSSGNLWLGASTFAAAPFKVGSDGQAYGTGFVTVQLITAGEDIAAGKAVGFGNYDSAKVITLTSAVKDTYVDSANATTNYSTDTQLRVGSSDTLRTFIYIPSTEDISDKVTSVKLRIYSQSITGGASNQFNIYRCTTNDMVAGSASVTWNAQPTYDTSVSYNTTNNSTTSSYLDLDITSLWLLWRAGVYPNYGLAIVSSDATVQFFHSMEGGNPVTVKTAGLYDTSKIYKTDSTQADSMINFVGFVLETVTTGNQAKVQISDLYTGLSGLSAGKDHFLSSTDGGISDTPASVRVKIGRALSSTSLLIEREEFKYFVAGSVTYNNLGTEFYTIPIYGKLRFAYAYNTAATAQNISMIAGVGNLDTTTAAKKVDLVAIGDVAVILKRTDSAAGAGTVNYYLST